MKVFVRKSAVGVLFLAAACLLIPVSCRAQDGAKRPIVERAAPRYPDLARSMALTGIVKIDALVLPDGTVKSVEVKGGHPVLGQAAANAVRHWKWEPSTRESHELVEIKFSSPD
jgi:TonB family protein